MKNPENREIMAELYRVLEKYEEPAPDSFVYVEDAQEYFSGLLEDLRGLWGKHKDNSIAEELGLAIYNAIERNYQQRMKKPLIERGETA